MKIYLKIIEYKKHLTFEHLDYLTSCFSNNDEVLLVFGFYN
jgi:hypothetical protein